MPWSPDYATLAEFKVVLNITDTADDASLERALKSAFDAVDRYTGRQFGAEASAVARYYGGQYDSDRRRYVASIDDLMTTTDLVVTTQSSRDGAYDTTLVLDTDFQLAPFNAAADQRPWTMLVTMAGATLPCWEDGVKVAARFGWTTVPYTIQQASLIQAARFWKRKDAPFGVAGSPELGSELRLLARVDPDVAVLLDPYRRRWGAV